MKGWYKKVTNVGGYICEICNPERQVKQRHKKKRLRRKLKDECKFWKQV